VHVRFNWDESAGSLKEVTGNLHPLRVSVTAVVSIVDNDESIRDATKTLLRSVGYEVETFASAELFLESGALQGTQCLILDIRMPGMGGPELQGLLNAGESRIPIIFVSAHDEHGNRRRAIAAGAMDFFSKPFSADALVEAVRAAMRPAEA
jgi:FixJ family two-component response regulator